MHFLVPIDGSEAALRAVEFATKLAVASHSKITILAVRQYIVGRHLVAAVWSQDEIDGLLMKAKKLVTGAGIENVLATELNARDIAHAIVNYTEEHKVDLVVIDAVDHAFEIRIHHQLDCKKC
jgi:nucleotide-binding universal stress UspA family protein